MASLDIFKFDVVFKMESANCDEYPEYLLDWMYDLGLFNGHPRTVTSGEDVFLDYLKSETTDNERCNFEYRDCCTYYSFNVTFEDKNGRTILDEGTVEDVRSFYDSLSILEEAFITRYRLRKFQQFANRLMSVKAKDYPRINDCHDAREVIENEARAFAATVSVFQKYGYTFEPEMEAA